MWSRYLILGDTIINMDNIVWFTGTRSSGCIRTLTDEMDYNDLSEEKYHRIFMYGDYIEMVDDKCPYYLNLKHMTNVSIDGDDIIYSYVTGKKKLNYSGNHYSQEAFDRLKECLKEERNPHTLWYEDIMWEMERFRSTHDEINEMKEEIELLGKSLKSKVRLLKSGQNEMKEEIYQLGESLKYMVGGDAYNEAKLDFESRV